MYVKSNPNRPGLKMLAAQARERNIAEQEAVKAAANQAALAKVANAK